MAFDKSSSGEVDVGRNREACWLEKEEERVKSFRGETSRSGRISRTWKMAQRRGRATSRCAGGTQTQRRRNRATSAIWLWICLLFPSAAEAGLYSLSDQIILLNAESVKSVLINSTAAIVAEFYASWCGHCIAFSPLYKTLARDIKGWFRAFARHQIVKTSLRLSLA